MDKEKSLTQLYIDKQISADLYLFLILLSFRDRGLQFCIYDREQFCGEFGFSMGVLEIAIAALELAGYLKVDPETGIASDPKPAAYRQGAAE
jgi:hypothetical protein